MVAIAEVQPRTFIVRGCASHVAIRSNQADLDQARRVQRGLFHPIFEIEFGRIALIESTKHKHGSVDAEKDSFAVLLKYPHDIGEMQFSLLDRPALLE